MFHGFIYLTTNNINGKQYIGQTTRKESFTYFGSGKAIKKAIVKHGILNFTRVILAYGFTKSDLDFLEQHFISEYRAQDNRNFYNIAEGGKTTRGFTGKTHTEEHKQAVRERMLTDHPNKGKLFSDETCSNMSKSKIGYSYGVWTLTLDDTVIEVPSLAAWCREHKLDYSAIKKTLKSKKPHTTSNIQVISYCKRKSLTDLNDAALRL